MSNNYKAIFSFEDENISLIVVSGNFDMPVVLFQKSIQLDAISISNFYVTETNKIAKLVSNLMDEAIVFLGTKIRDVYVVIDTKEIKLKNFECPGIDVPNGILDSNVWNNEMLSSMSTDNNGEEHIFNISFFEWVINGQTYYSLDSQQHKVDTIDVKGIMYGINRVLYEQYLAIFENLDLNVKLMIPFAMCYPLLVTSNRTTNCEVFVNLNNNGLVLTTTKGNRIISNISFKELSLNSFFDHIKEKTMMSLNQIKKYFQILPDIQNSSSDLKIANGYSKSYLHLTTITNKDISRFIQQYADSIADFIKNKFIVKISSLVDSKITRLNLFPTNTITEIIFKNVTPSIEMSNGLIQFNDAIKIEPIFNKVYAMAKYILNEQKNNINLPIPNRKSKTGLMRKE